MAEVEVFSALLHETIAQNKLSGSRVKAVTENASKAMSVCGMTDCQDPSSLARAMSRAHLRSAPKTKLISLYLFDAVARHAQEIVRRNGAGFAVPNQSSEQLASNAQDFLRALQEPAAEVGMDCLRNAPSEQHEKVLKVIDIWERASTFHPKILQRIHDFTEELDAGKSPKVDPPLGPPGLPANVLAMLGAGAKSPSAATSVSEPSRDPRSAMSSVTSSSHNTGSSQRSTAGIPPSAPPVPPTAASSHLTSPPPPGNPVNGSRRSNAPPGGWPPGGGSAQTRQAPAGGWPPGGGSAQVRGDLSVKETLQEFDQSSFDPTNPAEWERLSKMWENTYQTQPSGPELMMALSMYTGKTNDLVSGMLSKDSDNRWSGMPSMNSMNMMPGMPMGMMPSMPSMPGMPGMSGSSMNPFAAMGITPGSGMPTMSSMSPHGSTSPPLHGARSPPTTDPRRGRT
ncbi:hypothetical protein MYAM1_002741 [Malassezia yamatoensis]|uniref:CID domain-containing protein n=1 Tax=Malassezia yamatoensis TaxID=253288 RepID=A0AAJ5YT70_9BASI|nr:hypothetical protein MYAM1_002741 [Malassezia yamatoensis]